jgi:voltage-gated potassium channel
MYNNYNNLKKHVYTLLHPAEGNTRWDKLINTFLITLIVLNVLAVIMETVESIHSAHKQFFKDFDNVSVVIFSIEYLLRLWSANYHEKYKHSIKGRLKYFFSLGAMIDLIAILPTFLHIIFPGVLDLRILRMFRLARILRLFRLTAYTKSAQMILNVFKSRFNDLMLSFILTIFLIIISSCLVYFAEHRRPDSLFTSIPATMWWAVVTLTTVGYGEMYPLTILGKIFSVFIMLSGVALLALPAGIITSGFLDELKNVRKPKPHTCPHCGLPIDDTGTSGDHHH